MIAQPLQDHGPVTYLARWRGFHTLASVSCLLTALAAPAPVEAQALRAALIVDGREDLTRTLAPSIGGLLASRGYDLVDSGAVMAARAHLFGSVDADIDDDAQTALAEALGVAVLTRVQLLPVEGSPQTAVQLRVTSGGATQNHFLLVDGATLSTQVLEALAGLEALRPSTGTQEPAATTPAQSTAWGPRRPTTAASPDAAPIAPAPSSAARVAAPGYTNKVEPHMNTSPSAEIGPQETDAGFWWSVGAQFSMMSFPDGGWVDGLAGFQGTMGYAFTDNGLGVGGIVAAGTPTIDLGLDGFFTVGGGLLLNATVIGVGYSTFMEGSVFFGYTGMFSLVDEFGLSVGWHGFLNPDRGTFAFTVGVGLGVARDPAD